MKVLWLLIAALVFWFAETTYFGWNMRPICETERLCDLWSQLIMFWCIGWLMRDERKERP